MQDDVLLAYQLCFDLFENESQAFNFKVTNLAYVNNDPHSLSIRFQHMPIVYQYPYQQHAETAPGLGKLRQPTDKVALCR